MNGLIPQKEISHRRLARRTPTSFAIVIAAALFALVMAGCGTKSETETGTTTETTGTGTGTAATTATAPAQLPDAPKLMAESARTTETLRTLHIVLTATNLPSMPVSNLSGDVSSEQQGNGQAVGDAKFHPNPEAPYEDIQFLVTNKVFYTKGDDGKWNDIGPADKIYDPAIILDQQRGLANVIKQVKNPKAEAKETIDGVATVKVSGTIDAAVIDPLVPTLGQGGGELPITLWIADVAPPGATPAPTTSLPSEQASPGTGPNLVRFVVNKDQGNVNVTFSNWAKPVTIPSPTG